MEQINESSSNPYRPTTSAEDIETTKALGDRCNNLPRGLAYGVVASAAGFFGTVAFVLVFHSLETGGQWSYRDYFDLGFWQDYGLAVLLTVTPALGAAGLATYGPGVRVAFARTFVTILISGVVLWGLASAVISPQPRSRPGSNQYLHEAPVLQLSELMVHVATSTLAFGSIGVVLFGIRCLQADASYGRAGATREGISIVDERSA